MELFSMYFEPETAKKAYRSEWEAVGDIRGMADMCLTLVF